ERALHRSGPGRLGHNRDGDRAQRLNAPQPSAPAARVGRRGGLEVGAELLVTRAVPDLPEGLAEGVTEDEPGVIMGPPRRDAARQDVAVGGDVRQAPRALAARPGARLV